MLCLSGFELLVSLGAPVTPVTSAPVTIFPACENATP